MACWDSAEAVEVFEYAPGAEGITFPLDTSRVGILLWIEQRMMRRVLNSTRLSDVEFVDVVL